MRVLVTGGSGFLGKHVVRELSDETLIYDRVELTDREECQKFFAQHKPEVVVHLAAACGGIGANSEFPATFVDRNVRMALNVFEMCQQFSVSYLVCAGSVCSYPKSTTVPFRETDLWMGEPEPTNAAYGESKRMLVTLSRAYRQQHGLNSCVLLLTNMYGSGDNYGSGSHAVAAIIKKVFEAKQQNRHSVDLWGSGQATRDFLHVSDAARAFRLSVAHRPTGAINIGTGTEVSIAELVSHVAELCNYTGEVRWDMRRPDGQPRRCLDMQRAQSRIGFAARTRLIYGLKDAIADYQSRHGVD